MVSTSALVVIGQCNSFDVVENRNCVSAKQNRGGNLEGESLRWQGWWKDPLQLTSHAIQRRHAGTEETLLNKTSKGNYHFELWELICFSCLFAYQHDVFVQKTDQLQTVFLLHWILFFGSLVWLYWATRFIVILNVLVFKMPRIKLQVCASRNK